MTLCLLFRVKQLCSKNIIVTEICVAAVLSLPIQKQIQHHSSLTQSLLVRCSGSPPTPFHSLSSQALHDHTIFSIFFSYQLPFSSLTNPLPTRSSLPSSFIYIFISLLSSVSCLSSSTAVSLSYSFSISHCYRCLLFFINPKFSSLLTHSSCLLHSPTSISASISLP